MKKNHVKTIINKSKQELDRLLDKFVLLEASVLLAGGFKVQHWHRHEQTNAILEQKIKTDYIRY
jgi:hypothetical protein